MISIVKKLSPTLASLLCKEFPRNPCWLLDSAPDVLRTDSELAAVDRFQTGLEECRIDLFSDGAGGQRFCEIALDYLEALLEPTDSDGVSGIQATAMAVTDAWDLMTDEQRQALVTEAAELHTAFYLLAHTRSASHELMMRPSDTTLN